MNTAAVKNVATPPAMAAAMYSGPSHARKNRSQNTITAQEPWDTTIGRAMSSSSRVVPRPGIRELKGASIVAVR